MCLSLARLKLFKSESLTMEDLKRSSSCHNFSSEKAKRRQELNSSPLIKHPVRPTLSASSSPQTSHRKSKVATALSFPLTAAFTDDKEKRLNHVFDSSKPREKKMQISSSNSLGNTYARPQLKQTPSIVINSPPSSDRRVVDVADITFEEPTTQGEKFGRSRPGEEGQVSYFKKEPIRGADRSESKYPNKEIPGSLQQQTKGSPVQFQPNNDREPYSRYPYEKQRGNIYEYDVYAERERGDNVHRKSPNEITVTDAYRDLQTREAYGFGPRNVISGAPNVEPKARNVDNGARIASPGIRVISPGGRSGEPRTRKLTGEARSPGARNLDRSSSDEERTGQKIRTSPTIFSVQIDNPEGFQKPKPKYISEDANDGSGLCRVNNVGNNMSVENKILGQASTGKPTLGQIPRQSQSEVNLKSKNAPERTMYPAVKTLSDPVSRRDDHSRITQRDGTFPSETSLPRKNVVERQLKSPENRSVSGNDMSDKCPKNRGSSPLLRRLGKNEVGSEHQEGKHRRDAFSPVSNELYHKRDNKDNFQAVKNKANSKTDFDKTGTSLEIGKSTANEPKTRPRNTTLNRGRTNDSFQVDKEMSTETNSTGKGEAKPNERPQSEVFGGLLGETDANCSAEYYDRMISKINEQINLAVSRNKSPYAVYGLGSDDDDDDWC